MTVFWICNAQECLYTEFTKQGININPKCYSDIIQSWNHIQIVFDVSDVFTLSFIYTTKNHSKKCIDWNSNLKHTCPAIYV